MKLWNDFVNERKKEFGWQTVDKWLATLKIKHFDACNLFLVAHDSFQYNWVQEHIIKAKFNLLNNNGHKVKLHLEYHKEVHNEDKKKPPLQKQDFAPDKLLDHALFSEFICSDDNEFTLKVLCNAGSYDPQTNSLIKDTQPLGLNPIYLCGPPSSGKSHLLMALARSLQLQGKKIRFVNGQTFTEHVVYAFRSSNMHPFRASYRNVDALFVDNIEAIAGKAATQEEFFHTFNALHTQGTMIVLSSQYSPRFLQNIEERLQSRFEWGITLNLEKIANIETITKVLQKRVQLYHLKLSKELEHFITRTFKSIQAVCQAIDTLSFQFQERRSPIEKEEAMSYLNFLIKKVEARQLQPDEVIKLTAQDFGLKKEDLLNKSQLREFTLARHIAMYLLRHNLNLTYKSIAQLFERDHSTVMSSIKKVSRGLTQNEAQIRTSIDNLQKKFASYS
jgi:chromosomal replication initiator protein